MNERTSRPEQLTLLQPADVPLQFRIDLRTRQIGLQQIAAIRAQMAARRASEQPSAEHRAA